MKKMTLKERIKVYVKHPKCIIYDIRDGIKRKVNRRRFNLKQKLIGKILKDKAYSEEFKFTNGLTFNASILQPCTTVYLVFEKFFPRTDWLRIHGIMVNTQDDKQNVVDVYLIRCGIFIGKSGNTIMAVEEELTKVFGKKTVIRINEVKSDINSLRVYNSF